MQLLLTSLLALPWFVPSVMGQQEPLGEQDPFYVQALEIMEKSPLIDTHVDLPQIIRSLGRRPLEIIPQLAGNLPGHVDIPRMRKGRLGGAFWTVWAPCHGIGGEDPGEDFNNPTNALRDSLEMLDLIQNMIKQHPDHLEYAHSSTDVQRAFQNGKIASLIGMEGTHLLGNSLGAMRIFAQMGVRYITLTHMCHSAFASANGLGGVENAPPVHPGNGLTDLGRDLIRELNRLGVLIDLSHTSDNTSRQALELSTAPVIWTHAGSRAIWDHQRNIPDDILHMIGDGPGKNKGLVHSIFYPAFLGPSESANVSTVANHIEHIASIVGRKHVGIGSDFDGIPYSVKGLDDVSQYPNLVAEFLARGWNESEVQDLMGGNLLRVMDEVDAVRDQSAHLLPSAEIWDLRKDLPAEWGGANDFFYPVDVRDLKNNVLRHDEL
ncbi:dipeptidase-2 [Coleophoma crateriformis]|uniref:Dipeptidase n=1 Tax=Coleophoma crateriformis TaxID=565419 RepID=A0A3D8Q5X9_9HELO|nr:dipeptidase-2 [Coleophoma crateriformis]